MKAMILSAGLGTRLKPFTNNHPKALAVVNGKTLLERNIRFLQSFGINEVVVNVHHFADQIIQAIQEHHGFGSEVIISDERDAVLETGGGIKKAIPLLQDSDPVLVCNVDVLSKYNLNQLIQFHNTSRGIATLAVQKRVSSRNLLFDKEGRLWGWKNLKTGEIKLPSNQKEEELVGLAFSGIQLLSQDFLSKIRQEGKFSIIDTYLSLCAHEKIMGWEHSNDLWLDVGKPEKLAAAQDLFF